MKRFISILLCVAMCVSLLPLNALAASGITIEYVFSGSGAIGLYHSSAIRSGNAASDNSALSAWPVPTDKVDGTYRLITFTTTGKPMSFTPGSATPSGSVLAAGTWEITVSKDATYTPTVSLLASASSPVYDVYLTKKNTSNPQFEQGKKLDEPYASGISASDYIGTIDGFGASDGSVITETFSDKVLTAGTYYLTFAANGSNATEIFNTNYVPLLPVRFKLVEYKAPVVVYPSDFKLVYDFTKVNAPEQTPLTSVTDKALTHGFWSYNSAKSPTSSNLTRKGFMYLTTKVGEWVALNISVPVAGIYSASLEYSPATSGGVGEVYLFPAGTSSAAITSAITSGDATSLGVFDCCSTNTEGKPVTLSDFRIEEAGEQILVFCSKAAGDGGKQLPNMYPVRLTLGAEKTQLAVQSFAAEDIIVNVGKSKEIPVSGYLSDYTELDKNNCEITYKPEKDGVVSIDKNGVVTGVSEDKIEVEVTAKSGVSEKKAVINVTVLPETYSGYSAVYDFGSSADITAESFRTTQNRWQYLEADDGYVAFEINIPYEGTYEITADSDFAGAVKLGSDVASAEAAGATFDFPSAGKYTVVFESADGSYPDTLTLYGGEMIKLVGVKLSFSGTAVSADAAVYSDGSEKSLSGAEVVYGIDNFAVASVDKKTGKVLAGKDGGQAVLFADVSIDGETAHGEIEADIAPLTVEASMITQVITLNSASDSWIKAPAHLITDGGSYHIWDVTGIDYTDTDGNWAWYEGNKSGQFAQASSASTSGGVSLKFSKGAWAAFRIKVPGEGLYWVSTTGGKHKNDSLGVAEIYFMAADAVVDAGFTTENLAGKVDYYIDHTIAAYRQHTDELGAIYFPAEGEYLVVFKDEGNGKNILPRLLVLDGQNVIRFLEFKPESTDLLAGNEYSTVLGARLLDGSIVPDSEVTYIYKSDDEQVARFENGKIHAVGEGSTTLTLTAVYEGSKASESITVNVTDTSPETGIILDCVQKSYVGQEIELSARVTRESGSVRKLDDSLVTYTVISGDAVTDDNLLTATAKGDVIVRASYNGFEDEATITFREGTFKTGSTYYTDARREAAWENAEKYTWARDTVKSAIEAADEHINNIDILYNTIWSQGMPRGGQIGLKEDPDYKYCRYCGVAIADKYADASGRIVGGYSLDMYNHPWKLQCLECKRRFPSNDFGSFYELGLDEYGQFDVDRARTAHHIMLFHSDDGICDCESIPTEKRTDEWYEFYGYGNQNGYLYNESFTELWKDPSASTYNVDPRTKDPVNGLMWGVDDSFGYVTGRQIEKIDIPEVHTYISTYAYEIIYNAFRAMRALATAYVYTDDAKYGRAAALLFDRFADFYHDYTTNAPWFFEYSNVVEKGNFVTGGGGGYDGKIRGRISDTGFIGDYLNAADALYPLLMKDETLVRELSQHPTATNPKTNADLIWEHWADNIIRETFDNCKTGDIYGNYGMQQDALATAALVLACEPESSEMIEWIFKPGEYYTEKVEKPFGIQQESWCSGGDLNSTLTGLVDRDGMGDESSPSYNAGWVLRLVDCAEALNLYADNPEFSEEQKLRYDIYKNPKFAKMFTSIIPMTLTDSHVAEVGDFSAPAALQYALEMSTLKAGFMYLKDSNLGNELAEELYRRNGYTVEGLVYDIFTENPESIQDDILARIDDNLYLDSGMLTGYGFAVLRDGGKFGKPGTPTYTNNMRDFWMIFDTNERSHAHHDTLSIGIDAYGLNMAPDFGYPEKSGYDLNRYQWCRPTISHNTVTVNEKQQLVATRDTGTPKHFDDSDAVKLMDVDASDIYDETSIYRRTVVMIEAGPDVSYGVDFFRIKGGNDHLYSFHSQSDEIYETAGLDNIVYQTDDGTADGNYIGSYAGADVKYGADPSMSYQVTALTYPAGYTWMKNVRRDTSGVENFSVDFKVTDYRNAISDNRNLHMRLTMLNDGYELSEVALTSGMVPVSRNETQFGVLPETFEYVLARRSGKNLDTLYTTVYEPYKGERYISEMSSVAISTNGKESGNDAAKAVKVVRRDSDGKLRTDYIVYTTNNKLTYTITDGSFSFDFRGFVGVYSLNENGVNIYSYVHDGDIIADKTYEKKAYTGKVSGFEEDMTMENYIDLESENLPDDISELDGEYVFISNDMVENAVYKVERAEKIDGGVRLHTGAITAIRDYKDENDEELGYVYNIAKGQNASIHVSNIDDDKPTFDDVGELTATAGSTFTTTLRATVESGAKITYYATNIPRGASVNASTGTVTWRPDASQTGENHFAITAYDETGREATKNFVVTVYGSTTRKPSTDNDSEGSTDTTDTPSGGGGGGGGGGGAAPAPDTDENVKPDDGETTNPDNGDDTPVGEGVPALPSKGFTDLTSHAWASDAINELAEKGVIKGTSETTFSPASNITRADFALLLVRAFELSSDNTENFADVAESDYFARELAIARNCGIVGGIGDNKYAPRNTITRQDMMVIVYRALQALEKMPSPRGEGGPLAVDEVGRTYPDFTNVAPYATDAVSALISAGLVNGKNGKIDPTSYTTRAEVAVLIKRILDYIK